MSNFAILPKSANGSETVALAKAILLPSESSLSRFPILDVYAPDGIAYSDNRVDAFATISAGEKAADGKFPTRSKDGKMFLHDPDGNAPGLEAALRASEYKTLTIAFPTDDLSQVIQQRFTEYSQTALLAYGDEKQITQLTQGKNKEPVRRVLHTGTKEYAEQLARCKVATSVYFHLAQWTNEGPQVVFPDGLGYYRLRFTSRNSARRIIAAIQMTARYFGGRIAGVPFQLSLENAEVAGPDGSRRKVPVWNCRFVPPEGFSLSSQNFRHVAEQALAQGAQLMLPAPQSESLELAADEGADLDLDEAAVSLISRGGACDTAHYRSAWFARVSGTPLDCDAERAQFVGWFCGTYGENSQLAPTTSLSKLLEQLNEENAGALLKALEDEINWRFDERMADYETLQKEGVALGIARRDLPEKCTFATLERYIDGLQKAVDRRKNPAPLELDIEATSPKVAEKKSGGIVGAIRQKRDAATVVTPEVDDEIAHIYGDEDISPSEFPEGEIVTDDELGDLPEHVLRFMAFTHDSHGVQHGGDFAHVPTVAAINAYRSKGGLPPIESIASLSDAETLDLIGAFNRKQIEVGLL